jgi:hypothetical protein
VQRQKKGGAGNEVSAGTGRTDGWEADDKLVLLNRYRRAYGTRDIKEPAQYFRIFKLNWIVSFIFI